MADCELRSSCFFYNDAVTEMSYTVEYLRNKYCNGDFTKCTRFRISESFGSNAVPTYIYPNDFV